MARAVEVTSVSTGRVLDTVTLTDEGTLAYATGRARKMFEGKLRRDESTTPQSLFEQMSGWSNGYVAVTPVQEADGTVEAHMPGGHNQQTHGRRYGPDGNPLRRLTQGGRRGAVRTINRLLRDLRGNDAATRPGMSGGPLTDLLRSVRDGVDGGQFSPDQALTLLSSLVFRPDVASNPQLSTALAEAISRLREGDRLSASGCDAMVQVAAAADVRSGAMVALLPSVEDAQRLAVDGGEAAEQLHATVLFLGEADAYPPEARQAIVDAVRALAEVIPPGEVDGMAIAAFNPDKAGKDTAIVVELGGEGLEDVHGLVEQAVTDVAAEHGLMIPEQHAPYRPHVTLLYSDDLMNVPKLADRAGPVRIERLRVAFAGENVDIPLSGEGSDLDVDSLTDDDMPVVASHVAAQAGSDAALRRYWLTGKGSLKIRWRAGGDFTRCVRQLRKYVRDPKGLCAEYHFAANGFWPGDRRNASAPDEEAMALPNPNPTVIHATAKVTVDDVRTAYYQQAPQQAWIREFHTSPQRLIVANDADGTVARVDFEIGDDGQIRFGSPVPVRVEYVEQDDDAKVAASRMVYASAVESRPSVVTSPSQPDPEPLEVPTAGVSDRIGDEPPDSLLELAGSQTSASADPQPKPPAAEPGNQTIKEDDMPLSTEVYQRLGLAEDADETAVTAAVMAALDKADQAPDPNQVAAAAAEKDELTKEVGLLKGQVQAMSAKLAETEAAKAAEVKASVLNAAQSAGKFPPAEREQWEADYDEAPAAVTRVLASIAEGTAVPVIPKGKVGDPWDVAASDDDLPPEPSWLDPPRELATAATGKDA